MITSRTTTSRVQNLILRRVFGVIYSHRIHYNADDIENSFSAGCHSIIRKRQSTVNVIKKNAMLCKH